MNQTITIVVFKSKKAREQQDESQIVDSSEIIYSPHVFVQVLGSKIRRDRPIAYRDHLGNYLTYDEAMKHLGASRRGPNKLWHDRNNDPI